MTTPLPISALCASVLQYTLLEIKYVTQTSLEVQNIFLSEEVYDVIGMFMEKGQDHRFSRTQITLATTVEEQTVETIQTHTGHHMKSSFWVKSDLVYSRSILDAQSWMGISHASVQTPVDSCASQNTCVLGIVNSQLCINTLLEISGPCISLCYCLAQKYI